MQIYIDGDACPVKQEALKVAARHALPVVLVSNQWLRGVDGPLVRQHVAPNTPDAADDWIVEQIGPGDICVTADIPLAARVIKAGAACIGPNGKPYITHLAARAGRLVGFYRKVTIEEEEAST